MTASVLLVGLLLGGVKALVDLDCSDNSTCIEAMGRDLVQSLRERKAVRLFNALTIEPLSRQGRSSGLWGLMENHAVSFDWSDFTFKFTMPQDGRDDALDLEMYENRSVKEETDTSPKKASSKVEEEKEDDKTPKMGLNRGIIKRRRRRHKKKVLQAVIPLLFGMKSAGAVIFAFFLVSILTIKAFVASKLALVVTIGMALKKLYESYSTGIPETSNVLWTIARYFKILFGFPAVPPLSNAQTMTMPMYVMPQMYGQPDMMNMNMPIAPTTQ